jgi:hypothetical protein
VRPVLEQQALVVDEPVEVPAVVRAEAAPQGEVVGAVEDVDGVELEPADVLDEAGQAPGRERRPPRLPEMLAFEEERGDRS